MTSIYSILYYTYFFIHTDFFFGGGGGGGLDKCVEENSVNILQNSVFHKKNYSNNMKQVWNDMSMCK